MKQMERAVLIAEVKYPKDTNGWHHVRIFDYSSFHSALAEDSLDVTKMNVGPGGNKV